MSHSPTDGAEAADRDYLEGWGAVYELLRQGKSWSGRETHNAFLNLGDGSFADVSAVAGLDLPDDGRAVSVVDWDQDGALDLWIANRTGPQLRFLRNRNPGRQPSLALRLEGRRSNRDAVGARVELFTTGEGPRRRVAAVRSGSGYLAQSSRWLHFGLAGVTAVDRVEVRWPGGTTETFRSLRPGGRYRLVEGSGVAEPWSQDTGSRAPTPRPLPDLPSSGTARTFLATPLPLYRVAYLDGSGKPTELGDAKKLGDGPALINLWASWCVPCRGELSELESAADRLRRRNLSVLALSVDEAAVRPKALSMLDDLGWSFERGFAETELVDQLSVVQQAVVDQGSGMALPTSFLVDDQLRLWAIYRGPVSPQQLEEDLAALEAGRSDAALPFPGRWVRRPEGRNVEVLANVLRSRGRPELAAAYLESLGNAQGSPAYLRQGLGTSWEDLGRGLSQQNRWPEAVEALEKGVAVDPDSTTLRQLLAAALTEVGRHDDAVAQLEEALRRRPEDPALHTDLGLTFARSGRIEEAAAQFRAAVAGSRPEQDAHWLALYNLAVYHGESERFDQALPYLKRALAAAPSYFDAWRYLGVVEQRRDRPREAIAAYRKALEIEPGDARTVFYLGQAYVAAGDATGARQQLDRLRQLGHPSVRRLERDLATLESGTGN